LAHSLELWVDPYSGKTVVGKRWRTTDPVRGARRFALNFDGWGTLESLMNELDEHDLMRYSPKIVAAALNLVVKDDDYVLTAATGLDFGANNGLDMLTSAVAVRADDCVAAVNAIRELCATMRSDNGGGLYLTSPIGVRFVKGFEAASRPWLAPQFDVPTAMIELAGFRQVRCSQGALSQTVKLLVDSFEARPHWGQYLPDWYGHSAIRKSYGDKSVTAFIEARRQLDPRGLFNNAFSERLRLDP